MEVGGPEDPVACRGGGRGYAFQPLSRVGAIGPADGAIRIESGPERPAPAPTTRTAVSERTHHPRATPPAAGGDGPPDNPAGAGGLAPLIQEAVALHESLGEARTRAARLIGALRRERKRSRLLSSTLAQLRALRLQEVAE